MTPTSNDSDWEDLPDENEWVDVEEPAQNVVEPKPNVGLRVRGDLADAAKNPAGFLGYEFSRAAEEAVPGLRDASEVAAQPLDAIAGDVAAELPDYIPGLREDIQDVEADAISSVPAVQAAGAIIPPLAEAQQRSEGLRSSAFFGISDTVDKLKSVDTFLNLFTEEGREKNKEGFLDIAKRTVQGMKDSLTGKDKKQFGLELEKRGVPRTLAPTMGFAMEMATDPLTYLIGGGAKAAEKATETKLAAEAERIIPDKVFADLEFLTRPDKTAADYAQEISKTQEMIAKLNKYKDNFSEMPLIYKKKEKELRATLKQLRIDAVYSEASDFARNAIKRTVRALSLISSYLEGRGQYGAALARQVERADKTMNLMRSEWISRFDSQGNLGKIFNAMTQNERMNFVASLEGFEKPVSDIVKKAFTIADGIRQDIAQEAIKRGMTVKTKVKNAQGKFVQDIRSFIARGDYFPHYAINPKRLLIDPDGLKEALEYAVRTGKFSDMEEATQVFEAYSNAVKSFVPSDMIGETLSNMSVQANAKNGKFFDWLVKTGQAKDVDQAVSKFNSHLNKIELPKNQSLEMERTINLPFYDVDPTRVFARYFSGAAKRFGEIDHFGISAEPEIVNSLIRSMEIDLKERGIENYTEDIAAVKDMMSLIIGSKTPKQVWLKGTSQFLRNMEAASSLTYAFVMNATQLINTASVVGMKNAVNAFVDAMTAGGKEYAFKSGAVFNEFTQAMYGIGSDSISGKLARMVLENITPFQAVERNNRVVTAIAAKNFVEELAKKLVAGEGKTVGAVKAAKALRKMDIRPEKILANNGAVDLEDLYKASQNIGTRTQFRARVQDVPEWASSEFGRIANQFKNFIEQQWKFMRNEIYREAKDGNYAPLLRYSVLAPTAGLLARELKANLTGRNSKLNNESDLANFASAVADVGAIGMMFDMYRNINYNGDGWIQAMMPAVNDFGKISAAAVKSMEPLINRFMGEPESKIIDMKPLVKALIPKTPIVSFFRTQLTDSLLDDEGKKKLATEYLTKAKRNGLTSQEIDTVKQGLKERYGLTSTELFRAQLSVSNSMRKKRMEVRRQLLKNRSRPLGYFGL